MSTHTPTLSVFGIGLGGAIRESVQTVVERPLGNFGGCKSSNSAEEQLCEGRLDVGRRGGIDLVLGIHFISFRRTLIIALVIIAIVMY